MPPVSQTTAAVTSSRRVNRARPRPHPFGLREEETERPVTLPVAPLLCSRSEPSQCAREGDAVSGGMLVGIQTPTQRPWPELAAQWTWLERLGFDSLWLADH